ncbi:MAG: tetratricopeptide repeat protein, partial [Verrucomicrobia bacterium]|nr:tetratricopeptide repeat protein [Verrucomicrobiota bacterium]
KLKRPSAPAAPNTQAPAATASPAWFTYFLCTLCGLLIGAAGTYLILAPKLQQGGSRPAASAGVASAAIPAPGTDTHVPAPELTAGLPPALADRTLGNFYYDHSDWTQAIRYYESAIKQGSDDADIRTDLGNAYRFLGRANEAMTQYQLAQKLNPQHEFSLFNQAGLYAELLGQPQEAINRWNEYLVRFPNGTNVAAAKQLIAQAQAQMSGLMPTAPVNPLGAPAAGTKAGDDLLERLKKMSEQPAPKG